MELLKTVALSIIIALPMVQASAQKLVTGVVQDHEGYGLPAAHISIFPDSIVTSTTASGQFHFETEPGVKTFVVTYVGFEALRTRINVVNDTTISMLMVPSVNELREVVVSGQRDFQAEIFQSNRTSTHILTKDNIDGIPVLGGEADVIKTIQLLPGTLRGVEGTSDLFVRGGAADQNLVLLDGAPIYNTAHLFGFLSVFNPSILDHVESINGGFPAQYGGRLSSILDVHSTSRLSSNRRINGDIGLIASRLYVEQPIVKGKASIWIAGRRTYIDQVVKALGENLPYFFYDLNGKVTINPSAKDHIEASYYGGEDILNLFRDRNGDGDGFLTRFESGNNTQSIRWNHYNRLNWESRVSLFRTHYKYNIENSFEENRLVALSDIEDYGLNILWEKDSLPHDAKFTTGIDWTRHAVSPNVVNTAGSVSEWLESSTTAGRAANEVASFVQYEWSPIGNVRVAGGMRLSSSFVKNKTYFYPEPRLSVRYRVAESQALKLSYSRMVQYLHRISNSAVSSPTDIWYPVTDSIKPQSSHQVALAWQRNFVRPKIFLSVEGYYKNMRQLIGYEEGTNLFLNTDFESSLIQGKGKAWGVEFLLRKDAGKLTGWISYTLSWTYRQFDEINNGNWFPSRYDRRHNGAVVMQYAFNKRWSASLVWEFISGARFTPVIGQYALLSPSFNGVNLIPVYSDINQVRLADSHRLDLGIKFRSKPRKKFQWHWFAGVYNTYNRANPVGINIEQDDDGSLRYIQPGLFGLLPFISYGFDF
jgi:outer membrane cobalamin receptor